MKKTFVNPEMNISLFDMENVVTASGGAATNAENAKQALLDANIAEANITSIDWAF